MSCAACGGYKFKGCPLHGQFIGWKQDHGISGYSGPNPAVYDSQEISIAPLADEGQKEEQRPVKVLKIKPETQKKEAKLEDSKAKEKPNDLPDHPECFRPGCDEPRVKHNDKWTQTCSGHKGRADASRASIEHKKYVKAKIVEAGEDAPKVSPERKEEIKQRVAKVVSEEPVISQARREAVAKLDPSLPKTDTLEELEAKEGQVAVPLADLIALMKLQAILNIKILEQLEDSA